jgi:protoheme IX farnesyltransferase
LRSTSLSIYFGLTKPKITVLNIVTAVTAFLLGGGDPSELVYLVVSGYLAVGGASAVNHYLDRKLDSLMSRTSNRPLPRGLIKPAWKAAVFGIALSLASIALSFYLLNPLTSFFIALGIVFYLVVYTMLLKRRTPWNIVIGGFAGSCAPLAGWAAATNTVGLLAVLLALLVFLWTPGHFWGLAIRAKTDYEKAGVPMLPVVVGEVKAARAVAWSNMSLLPPWLTIALLLSSSSSLAYLVLTAPITLLVLFYSVKLALNPNPALAWKVFKISSPWLAVATLSALVQLALG